MLFSIIIIKCFANLYNITNTNNNYNIFYQTIKKVINSFIYFTINSIKMNTQKPFDIY